MPTAAELKFETYKYRNSANDANGRASKCRTTEHRDGSLLLPEAEDIFVGCDGTILSDFLEGTQTPDGNLIDADYDATSDVLPAAVKNDWMVVGTSGNGWLEGEWYQISAASAGGSFAAESPKWVRVKIAPSSPVNDVFSHVADKAGLLTQGSLTLGHVSKVATNELSYRLTTQPSTGAANWEPIDLEIWITEAQFGSMPAATADLENLQIVNLIDGPLLRYQFNKAVPQWKQIGEALIPGGAGGPTPVVTATANGLQLKTGFTTLPAAATDFNVAVSLTESYLLLNDSDVDTINGGGADLDGARIYVHVPAAGTLQNSHATGGNIQLDGALSDIIDPTFRTSVTLQYVHALTRWMELGRVNY